MSTLVIKGLPEPLHERLKEQARRNHRSLTKEAIALLERGVLLQEQPQPPPGHKPSDLLPPPIRLPGGPLTPEWIDAAISDGQR